MKKRYLYICIFLMAFCTMGNHVKAQDMGDEDDVNVITPPESNGSDITTITNPDGTVTYTFGNGGTLTLTSNGGYVSSTDLDVFNSNGSGGFNNVTPQASYTAQTLPTSAYPAGTDGSQRILEVYNADGSTTQYIYTPGTNNGWVLQTTQVIQSTNSSQPQPPADVPNYSTNNYTITPTGQYTYNLTFSDGSQLSVNPDGTYTVVSGEGNCTACTTNQAVLDLPLTMPAPELPPNPTQAQINIYLEAISVYSAVAQAGHAACPTGQHKDSCGHCVGGTSTVTPCTKDCLGVWGGLTVKDSCGRCVGGSTGRVACIPPTRVPCDPVAVKLDSSATKIMNDINPSPQMTQLRDSAQGTHEVSFSSYDSSGTSKVFPSSFSIGNNGNTHIVPIDTTKGANHKNINAIIHLHEVQMDPVPDCADLYNILNGRVYPGVKNIYLNNSFIICGDTLIDLNVSISDTVAAIAFINLYRQDSAVHFDSTGNNPEWSSTYKGNNSSDSLSMGQEFNNAVRILQKNNYPEELVWTYAQVYMMQRYNMGAKMAMKINGIFKEFSPVITKDSSGNLQDLKINICQ